MPDADSIWCNRWALIKGGQYFNPAGFVLPVPVTGELQASAELGSLIRPDNAKPGLEDFYALTLGPARIAEALEARGPEPIQLHARVAFAQGSARHEFFADWGQVIGLPTWAVSVDAVWRNTDVGPPAVTLAAGLAPGVGGPSAPVFSEWHQLDAESVSPLTRLPPFYDRVQAHMSHRDALIQLELYGHEFAATPYAVQVFDAIYSEPWSAPGFGGFYRLRSIGPVPVTTATVKWLLRL